MTSKAWVLAFILLLIHGVSDAQTHDQPVFVNERVVSPEEMDSMKKKALDGSQEMAIELMWLTFDDDDQEVPIFWARVAMENGSSVGRHGYASLLYRKDDDVSLARAAYHLRVLSEQGDGDALILLKEVEKKQRRLGYR